MISQKNLHNFSKWESYIFSKRVLRRSGTFLELTYIFEKDSEYKFKVNVSDVTSRELEGVQLSLPLLKVPSLLYALKQNKCITIAQKTEKIFHLYCI
jgi:hypothetical protein